MFNMFKKKDAASGLDGLREKPYNPMDAVRVVDGKVLYTSGLGAESPESQEEVEAQSRVHDTVLRLYGPDMFSSHMCGVLGWVGRKKSLTTLQNRSGDEDFQAALGIIYRRVMDGPGGAIIDRLSTKGIEDLVILAVGLGPLVVAVSTEISQKKQISKPVVKQNGPVTEKSVIDLGSVNVEGSA